MKTFEFNVFIEVNAENYDEAIDIFNHHVRHGSIRKNNVYVANIEEK